MCGIFGFSHTTNNTVRMTGPLAIYMSRRGTDSWGVTDGVKIYKSVGDICDNFKLFDLKGPTYHTRAASVGDVTARNAHPFKVIDGDNVIVGVHNGHISNHSDLKEKYKRSCQVDSEHIFHQLMIGKEDELSGWGTVVWYEYNKDKPEERIRYLSCFNSDALHIAKLKTGEFIFASTKSSIETAARLAACKIDLFIDVKKNKKYYFDPNNNDLMVYDQEMKWCNNPYKPFHTVHVGSAADYYNRRSNGPNMCPLPDCTNMVVSGHLICIDHFAELKVDIGATA